MEHMYYAKLNELELKPLTIEGLELLRKWRNDSQISRFFNKKDYISKHEQLDWFEKYLLEEDCLYWTINTPNKIIGALSIYNINTNMAEIGRFMIGDLEYRGRGYGYQSFLMAIKMGFVNIGLECLELNVHEKNIAALNIYKKIGFSINGFHYFNEEGIEYEMLIDRKVYKEKNPMYELIKVYEI